MTQDKFDYFYKEFEDMNYLLELANIQKSKEKTEKNIFDVYKKMQDYNLLKKKIIKEFSEINPDWTKNYNEYDSHPTRMKPFPEIYDLTELDEGSFNFFYKEFKKLEDLFYKAYRIEEDRSFDETPEEDEEIDNVQLDEDNEKKVKGFIGEYYSIESVLEYNKQEEKIVGELSKINEKWLESKNETRLTRYNGDGGLNVKRFEFPYIYTLFDKLIQHDIEIQKLKEERANPHKIDKKIFEFDEIKREILEME